MSALGQFVKDVAEAFNRLARPVLTILIASLYNLAAAYAFFKGMINWSEFAIALGPTNGMIIGFWFGEKAALKVPTTVPGKEPEEP